jgi:hypothetical protein
MINNKNLKKCIYSVYGLKIKSDISMPELPSIIEDQPIQIGASIFHGVVPKEIEDVIVSNEFYNLSKKEFYIYMKGVAHYYVANGSRIIVEPEGESDIGNIKLFLLGTCLGMLLVQRNTVAIHGGTVVVDEKDIIGFEKMRFKWR